MVREVKAIEAIQRSEAQVLKVNDLAIVEVEDRSSSIDTMK
jgi:hypothetical protein